MRGVPASQIVKYTLMLKTQQVTK